MSPPLLVLSGIRRAAVTSPLTANAGLATHHTHDTVDMHTAMGAASAILASLEEILLAADARLTVVTDSVHLLLLSSDRLDDVILPVKCEHLIVRYGNNKFCNPNVIGDSARELGSLAVVVLVNADNQKILHCPSLLSEQG